MPAEGAVGPSGSRRGGAGGARCSHGVASEEGAHGAHGAAAAQDDLWGTQGSMPEPPQAPCRNMAHWPQFTPQTSLEVPPAWPTLPLSGGPRNRNFSQDPHGHSRAPEPSQSRGYPTGGLQGPTSQ